MILFAAFSPTALASNVWTCDTEVEVVAIVAGNRGAATFDARVVSATPQDACAELVGKTHRVVLGSGEGAEVGATLNLVASLASHEETPDTQILEWKRAAPKGMCGCSNGAGSERFAFLTMLRR